MSILMAALKQQTHAATPASSDTVWRNVALVLALLLALTVGAVAGYMLLPTLSPKTPAAVIADKPAEPAQPDNIIAALMATNSADSEKQTAPAASAQQQHVATAADADAQTLAKPRPVSARQVEEFAVTEPVVTVTAQSEPDTKMLDSAASNNNLASPASEVSDELRDKFALALKATERQNDSKPIRSHDAPARDISMLDNQLLRQIPPLRFEAHVFATQQSQRWVKVNGKTLQEGQWVTADIKIKEITQQYVLLQLGNQLFSMAALSEWSGA